jgi:hypothetical protein
MKTTEALSNIIREALKGCEDGKINDALKMLYNYPLRNNVPWNLFPIWANPTLFTEGGHEG